MSADLLSLRSASRLLASRALASGSLLTLQIELTSRCPLRCVHCYNDAGVPNQLDRSRLGATLEDAAGLGCLFLSLTGGEVYAHPEFEAIISDARRLQFDVRIQTSGWHLDDRAAEFLASAAVSEVHLSIYSADAAVHDAVTRMPGSHARAIRAARTLRARRVRVVLKNVVMDLNAASYRSVQQLAEKLDCAYSMDATVSPCESGACGPCARRPTDDTLRDFYGGYAWSQLEAGYREPRERGTRRPLHDTPCLAGTTFLFLASDGKVYPCVDLKVVLGDVLKEPLSAIWRKSEALARIRALRWRDLPTCAACTLRDYCNHCMALAQNEHGDLFGPALENCRHAVVRRDLLRERGLIPASETELPPPLCPKDQSG